MAKRILLVDDDTLILRSLSSLLQKEGYEVVQADDGSSATQLAKERVFDLVITDIRMPGMNGLETIRKLQSFQKEKGHSQSRFMVITGFAEDEAPQQAIDLQVTEFLIKPFDISRFLQAVRDQFQEEDPHKFKMPAESFAEKVTPSALSIPNLKDGAFHFEKVILLKDTNLTGNTYFSNFALWQGELRELILISHPRFKEEMAKIPHVKMTTHSIYHRFPT
jgi:CheY-like chemotaxis protein